MLFRAETPGSPTLAISQPAHAWLSGQLLRAWAGPLPEPLLLAAEQHDIGWLDWETAPTFDPATGRPHLFRHVPSRLHAPMWARGVDRALHAWGRHVALLVSRHGSTIYTRFTDQSRLPPEDAAAVRHYLDTQAALQAEWAAALGLDAATTAAQADLVALSDTLSLLICGELPAPLTLDAQGTPIRVDATPPTATASTFTLDPWPFAPPELTLPLETRPLPRDGRFPDAATMARWHQNPTRTTLTLHLRPGHPGPGTAPERHFPPA